MERHVCYCYIGIITVVVDPLLHGLLLPNTIESDLAPRFFLHKRLPLFQEACGNMVLLVKPDDLDGCDIRHVGACKSLMVHDLQFGYRRCVKLRRQKIARH